MERLAMVEGRFRLDELAGSGGMGEVWRATDLRTGATVAVKIIRHTQREGITRFQREAEALAVLTHPGIVSYVAHGPIEDGRWFVAMEWVDGVDLAVHLQRGPMPLADVLAMARGITSAIAVVHGRGLVHRDLKPANIRLTEGRVAFPKLLDFGLARLELSDSGLTRTGALLGTAAYMSPEQARGSREIDGRSDLYALGCVLYECLVGAPPLVGEHVMATLAKVLLETPEPLRRTRPGLPVGLDELVAQLLAKSPDARPQSAEQVLDRLTMVPELEDAPHERDPASFSVTERHSASSELSSSLRNEPRIVSIVVAKRPLPSAAHEVLAHGTTLDAQLATPSSASPVYSPAATPSERLLAQASPESVIVIDRTDQGATMVDPVRTSVEPTSNRRSAEPGSRDVVTENVRRVVVPLGGEVQPIVGDCLLVLRRGVGVATDEARLTARCALGVREVLPTAPMAIATGRADVSGRWPVGEVIDRALSLLADVADAPDGIAIDEVTAGLLDGRFEVGGDARTLLLLRERDAAERPRTLLGRPAPFVGRDRELGTLHDLFTESRDEPGARVVLVVGSEGIGKSRLRFELLARIRADAESAEVLEARADPARAGSPFALAGALLRSAAGVSPSQPVELLRSKLLARVARHDDGRAARGTAGSHARRPTASFLAEIAGLGRDEDDARGERDDPGVHAQQLSRAWVDWLRRETTGRALALVLEDLHWGDLPSVLLIDAALRELPDRALFVAAFARPEVATSFPKLWEGRGLVRLELRELGRRAALQLVRDVLGERATTEVVDRIVERSNGNALHLEELVRAVAEGRGDDVPPTLMAMLQSRLEQLDGTARTVLRVASTFGTRFPTEGVRELLRGSAEVRNLDSTLARLVEREVLSITQEGTRGNTLHAFRHALVRDVAYASLTEHDRVLCHLNAGGWLATREAEASEVAEHLEKGRDPEGAASWYRRAAERAIRGQDYVRARQLAGRAIGLGARGEDRAAALLALARAHDLGGKNTDACDAAELALAELEPASSSWFSALEIVTLASSRLGRTARAIACADMMERHHADTPSPSAIQCIARIAMSLAIIGDHARAARMLDGVGAHAEALRQSVPITWAWVQRATAWRADVVFDPSRCLTLALLAADGYLRGGDERSGADALIDACDALLRLGRYEEVVETAERAIAIARRLEIDQTVAGAESNLAVARARLGQHDPAIEMLRASAAIAERQGYLRGAGSMLGMLAEVLLSQDRAHESLEAATRAIVMLEKTPPLRAWALATAAAAALVLGDPTRAIGWSSEGVEILDALGVIETGEIALLNVHADVLEALGDFDGAERFAVRSRVRAEQLAAAIADDASRSSFVTRVPEIARALAR